MLYRTRRMHDTMPGRRRCTQWEHLGQWTFRRGKVEVDQGLTNRQDPMSTSTQDPLCGDVRTLPSLGQMTGLQYLAHRCVCAPGHPGHDVCMFHVFTISSAWWPSMVKGRPHLAREFEIDAGWLPHRHLNSDTNWWDIVCGSSNMAAGTQSWVAS